MSQQEQISNLEIRRANPADLPALISFTQQARAAGELTNYSDAEIARFIEGLGDEPDSVFVSAVDDAVVGFLAVNWEVLYVAPGWRRRGIASGLVRQALKEKPDLALGPDREHPGTRDFLTAIGFGFDHLMQQMKRPADLEIGSIDLPDGFLLRTYEHRDFDVYFALWNRAFLDHPTPLQTSKSRMLAVHSRDNFDPTRIALIARAEDPDDLVGFITTRTLVEEDREIIGPIGAIGTDRSVRRLGLGRALLRWGIQRLKQDGAGPITLEVVTINERALPLYESEGFLPHQSWEFWTYKG